ncbi:glycosyltransferase [Microbacterium barkeri]|uniref:glycosyltransferase n=1 Tax=Microbacterium barkeri TaxID=33917 RepID=UPI00361CE0A0
MTFVHHPSNPLLTAILQRASALVFAPIEDFGIIPVEAMAAGTPVLANAIGGAVESVLDGVTGAHVHDWDSPSELRAAVDKALASSPAECRCAHSGSVKTSSPARSRGSSSGTCEEGAPERPSSPTPGRGS